MTFLDIVGGSETGFNPGCVSFVLQISFRFDRRKSVINDTPDKLAGWTQTLKINFQV